ncbi:zinc ribbon domain-containing protein [Streptomyces sp. NPDC046862]|uniref:Zn-ribbon domain-containing OB-fold protein n=1 Tax=Streptomyces sp. NPDC046862 TaxID=3154603 RepID=UPI0034541D37
MVRSETFEPTLLREEHEAAATVTTALAATAASAATIAPNAPVDSGQLLYQRCLWCGTPAYRRPFCRACGSMALQWERSAGVGAVLRRHGHVSHNTWFVAMDEGFNLLCQVTGTAQVVIGSRVSVVRAVAPLGQGLPVVEPTRPSPPSERW